MTIRASMLGLVIDVRVKSGDIITSGKSLIILEAIKMERKIHSIASGRVKSIFVEEKTTVEKNQPLLVIQASEPS